MLISPELFDFSSAQMLARLSTGLQLIVQSRQPVFVGFGACPGGNAFGVTDLAGVGVDQRALFLASESAPPGGVVTGPLLTEGAVRQVMSDLVRVHRRNTFPQRLIRESQRVFFVEVRGDRAPAITGVGFGRRSVAC